MKQYQEQKQTKFRKDIYSKLRKYVRKKKGRALLFGEMKKKLFGATWYGGRAFKRRFKQIFNLEESKEKGKVLLQEKK